MKKLKARNLASNIKLQPDTLKVEDQSHFVVSSMKEAKIKRMEDLEMLLSGSSKEVIKDSKKQLLGRSERNGIANKHTDSGFNVESVQPSLNKLLSEMYFSNPRFYRQESISLKEDDIEDEFKRFKLYLKTQWSTFSLIKRQFSERGNQLNKRDEKLLKKVDDGSIILDTSGGNSGDEDDLQTKISPNNKILAESNPQN